MEDGGAAVLTRSLDETAAALGRDERVYRKLFGPLVEHWDALAEEFLPPVLHRPRHPLVLSSFGMKAL